MSYSHTRKACTWFYNYNHTRNSWLPRGLVTELRQSICTSNIPLFLFQRDSGFQEMCHDVKFRITMLSQISWSNMYPALDLSPINNAYVCWKLLAVRYQVILWIGGSETYKYNLSCNSRYDKSKSRLQYLPFKVSSNRSARLIENYDYWHKISQLRGV